MINFLSLSKEQQRLILKQTATLVNLPAQAVEKDLWVTVVLQLVFTLPFADKIVFKGGTSLSKVFDKIDRFSEDIDLSLDRSIFGFEGDLTRKQVKKLRRLSSIFVRETFLTELIRAFDYYDIKELHAQVEPDGEGIATYPEPRKIIIDYESLFEESTDYIKPTILLEIGSRSLREPVIVKKVQSLVEKTFPEISTSFVDSPVTAAAPEKTFLEKAFLLHELFSSGKGDFANRRSRHLYDLEKMMSDQFAINAIKNDSLWESISHHRQVFTSIKDVDYSPDLKNRIILIPPEHVYQEWKNDYEKMRNSLIFGPALSFEELIARIKALEELFHSHKK